MPEAMEVRVANDLTSLGSVLNRLDAYCAALGMAPAMCRDVRLALDEILTNVILHAWPHGGNHAAELHVSAADGVLTCVVVDDGVPFDPVAHPAPAKPQSLGASQIGGYGLVLVRAIADQLTYTCSDGRNRLELQKIYRTR